MILTHYGHLWADETAKLLTEHMDDYLSEFITDPHAFAWNAALFESNLHYVGLVDGHVAAFARVELGSEQPGLVPIASIHDIVAKDGWGFRFFDLIQRMLYKLGREKILLWVRADKPLWRELANTGYEFKQTAAVGWANTGSRRHRQKNILLQTGG